MSPSFSLYHALKTVDYRGAERVVRINGLDTPYWREDIRACVAGGCDSIRIPKTEHAEDVHRVAAAIAEDEKTYGRPEGRSPHHRRSGVCPRRHERSGGSASLTSACSALHCPAATTPRTCRPTITGTGIELMGARQQMIIAARAAGVSASTPCSPT